MKIEVSNNDIIEKKADSRGRITIGMEYAQERIVIAILEKKE